jgi:methylenetetrahydrofolate reductase (NADPH)
MSAALDTLCGSALKARIIEFARGASMEITPHDARIVSQLADLLPPGTSVFVAHTPKATLADVVETAVRVEAAGFRASPHIAARRIESADALRDAAHALVAGGVTQVLAIAGDSAKAAGPYSSSLEVLQSGILLDAGIRRVGVAAHPEGHRAIGAARLWDALRDKQAFARRARIDMHVMTQFGFDPAAICAWHELLAEHEMTLPVHIGMAGPAPLPKLITYAMQCGVGASLRGLMRSMSAMRNIAGLAVTPDEMVARLVKGCATPGSQLVGPHFFAFGGALATAQWLAAVHAGRFEPSNDGQAFTIDAR